MALRRLFGAHLPSTWLSLLERLKSYALMKESCFDGSEPFDLLGVYHDLVGLIEALYEIHIRFKGRKTSSLSSI